MLDYIYRNVRKDEIVVVCVGVKNIVEADYLYEAVVGSWPWTNKDVFVRSEPTGLECTHIQIELED